MDHVAGRCTFKSLAMVTATNKVSAKLYGNWLRTGSKEFLKLLNSPMKVQPEQLMKIQPK